MPLVVLFFASLVFSSALSAPSCDCSAVTSNAPSAVVRVLQAVDDIQALECTREHQDRVDAHFVDVMATINTFNPCNAREATAATFETKCAELDAKLVEFRQKVAAVYEIMNAACRCQCPLFVDAFKEEQM